MNTSYTTPKEITEKIQAEIMAEYLERRAKRPSIRASLDFWWSVKWLHENGYVTFWPVGPEFEPETIGDNKR